jgi:hypothetical protein
MNILYNEEDFKKAYPYAEKYYMAEDRKPTSYPCLMETYTAGGGLVGESRSWIFVPLPDDVDVTSFLAGYRAGKEVEAKIDQARGY